MKRITAVTYFSMLNGWNSIKVKNREEAEKLKKKLEEAHFSVIIEDYII